jgi:hypothetical protein
VAGAALKWPAGFRAYHSDRPPALPSR